MTILQNPIVNMNYANGVDLFVRRRCGPSFPGWFLFMPLVLHTGHSTNRFKIPSSSVLTMFNAYISILIFPPFITLLPFLPSFRLLSSNPLPHFTTIHLT